MNSTQRITILFALVCSFCVIMSAGLVAVASAQEAPGTATPTPTSQPTTTADDNNDDTSSNSENNEEKQSIDTSRTEVTVAHVTIHDIRWYDDHVEIDITAHRADTVRVTDFAGDRFYWQDYDVEAGESTTISHDFRGENGYVSFAVESAHEGIELEESSAFESPNTGTIVSLLIGLAIAFLLIIELARRDGRLDKYRVEEV